MLYDLLNSQNKKKKMIPILLYHILYLLSTRSFSWTAQNIKKDRVVTLSPGSICTHFVVPRSSLFAKELLVSSRDFFIDLYPISPSIDSGFHPTKGAIYHGVLLLTSSSTSRQHPALICQGRIRTYDASESPMRI